MAWAWERRNAAQVSEVRWGCRVDAGLIRISHTVEVATVNEQQRHAVTGETASGIKAPHRSRRRS
jgi:hypothetical protein